MNRWRGRGEHLFGFARGSVQRLDCAHRPELVEGECVPLLELARRRSLLEDNTHDKLKDDLEEVARMISGLISGLDKRDT